VRASDQLLARLAAEIEEQQSFQDRLLEGAQNENRDLTDNEMELFTRSRDRLQALNTQLEPVKESRRISSDSQNMISELAKFIQDEKPKTQPQVEYRSAGAYVLDMWKAGLGAQDAVNRLETYNRAAAHQTTTDNPGLLPEQIIGPIINFIDESRPLVSALGARQLPSGSWSRPRITQHTQVAAQSAEKAELTSRKMLITKTALTPTTYGTYLNLSRQDLDWSVPALYDIVIQDMAGQYAIVTEAALGTALVAGGTAATAGTTIPTGAATAAGVSSAVWAAAGAVLTATSGAGRLILALAPDMLGTFGPVFPPINPQNAQSSGFQAADNFTGPNSSISGVQVVVSAGLAAGTALMMSTAAAEVYEDRIGALQVVEPSVLGLQVAYAGYFTQIVLQATGIQKIVKTP